MYTLNRPDLSLLFQNPIIRSVVDKLPALTFSLETVSISDLLGQTYIIRIPGYAKNRLCAFNLTVMQIKRKRVYLYIKIFKPSFRDPAPFFPGSL